MHRVIIRIMVSSWVLCAVMAHAEEECRIVAVNNAKAGIVAHPGTLAQMLPLLRSSNVDDKTEAAICCLACMPRVGTKVQITGRESTFYTIRVLEGPHTGCTGEIVTDSVGECQQ